MSVYLLDWLCIDVFLSITPASMSAYLLDWLCIDVFLSITPASMSACLLDWLCIDVFLSITPASMSSYLSESFFHTNVYTPNCFKILYARVVCKCERFLTPSTLNTIKQQTYNCVQLLSTNRSKQYSTLNSFKMHDTQYCLSLGNQSNELALAEC